MGCQGEEMSKLKKGRLPFVSKKKKKGPIKRKNSETASGSAHEKNVSENRSLGGEMRA